MELSKKEPLNENRAANLISDLNLELKMLLDKFSNFKITYNISDMNLLNNLQMVYEEIENFIEGNPKNVNTEDRTNIDIKLLKQNGISKIYVCEKCQVELGNKSREIFRHIDYCPKHPKTHTTKSKENHINSDVNNENKERKPKKEKKNPKNIDVKLPKKAKSFITGDFGRFLNEAVQNGRKLMEIPEYKTIEKDLYDTLKSTFPDMKLYFFGSRINGLSNENSDLDVFLDVGNVYHTYHKKTNEDKKINKIENLLKKKIEWKHFQSIKKARVPILRAYFEKYRIDCDISFSHGLGHLNSLLTKYIFELQPICYKMCIFLKQWLKKTTLSEVISTYAFVLLTIFFLQIKNLLPSIKTLQRQIESPVEIGLWQGDFVEMTLNDLKIEKIEDTNQKCLQFLKEFFQFYADFQFNTLIVCPFLGRSISKQDLQETNNLEDIPRYVDYYLQDPKENAFQINKPICVMDPLELNHNVTKGVSENWVRIMKHYWKITCEELTNREISM